MKTHVGFKNWRLLFAVSHLVVVFGGVEEACRLAWRVVLLSGVSHHPLNSYSYDCCLLDGPTYGSKSSLLIDSCAVLWCMLLLLVCSLLALSSDRGSSRRWRAHHVSRRRLTRLPSNSIIAIASTQDSRLSSSPYKRQTVPVYLYYSSFESHRQNNITRLKSISGEEVYFVGDLNK